MAETYCTLFKDPLMSQPPIWFKSLIGCEYLLQLPFFCAALYAMHTGKVCGAGRATARPASPERPAACMSLTLRASLAAACPGGSWIRLPGIAYSAHVCTTLVPVLAHILFDENPHGTCHLCALPACPLLWCRARLTPPLPAALCHQAPCPLPTGWASPPCTARTC